MLLMSLNPLRCWPVVVVRFTSFDPLRCWPVVVVRFTSFDPLRCWPVVVVVRFTSFDPLRCWPVVVRFTSFDPLRCSLLSVFRHLWRCPWCNGYRRWKWTRRHEFPSRTRLISFHHGTNTLEKGMNLILPPAMGK